MTKTFPRSLLCLLAPALACPVGRAQAIPAGIGSTPNIGFQLPQVGGSFNYALNASELISSSFYGNQGTEYTTNLSGDASYLSGSTRHPFSAIYSGGVLLANSGQPTTTYQSLALSQGYNTKNWNFGVQDAVSYLPESPVSGLSGVPGVGDLGIDPTPLGPDAGIGILTSYGPRVSNTVSGNASRVLTGRLSAQGSGYDSVQRFIGDNASLGVDNSSVGGTGGVTYHFDTRSALTLNYGYTNFTYGGTAYAFTTQSGTVDYSRQWSRRFSTDVYAGPQHISNGDPLLGQSSTQIEAGASASYTARNTFYTLGYARGVNNGSGVIAGSFSDSLIGSARRQFGRQWSASGSIGYSRSTSLPTVTLANFTNDSVAFSVQGVRSLGRRLSAFGSYTVEHQTTTNSNTALLNVLGVPTGNNILGGYYQIFGFGVSYSPGSLFFNR